MKTVYFDNSATTKISAKAAEAMYAVINEHWGNPSAVYSMGVSARKLVEDARTALVQSLGVKNLRSGKLYFTGSGTESDNLAILGTTLNRKYRFKPRVITTDSEHPAVLNAVAELAQRGFEVIYLSAKGGVIDLDELDKALTPETVLISVMRVNNETGAIYDVEKIFSLAKSKCPDIITHCDAVQGFMKINCAPQKMKADLVTVSGHKIGGPKGIGALWCDSELVTHKKLHPIMFGGGQEDGIRSGTENTIGIIGMSAAAKEISKELASNYEHVSSLRKILIDNLPEGLFVNLPLGDNLPHIISLYAEGIKSEVLVRYMSAEGVYISAGSACSSKKLKTSHALTSFGLAPDRADSTVRVSLSHCNTEEEVLIFIDALKKAVTNLARK